MTNTWCEISDKLLNSNKVGKVFTKGPRCIIGFKIVQNITVNGVPYKKVKGIDIKFKDHRVEITTEKETIVFKVKEFTFATIDEDLKIELK